MNAEYRRDLFTTVGWLAGLLAASALVLLPLPAMSRCLPGGTCPVATHPTPLWQFGLGLCLAVGPSVARMWREGSASPMRPNEAALPAAWARVAAGALRAPAAIIRKRRSRAPRR